MGVSISRKPLGVQEVADVLDHPVAQDEVLLHSRTAQVKVAVPQPQALVGPGVVGDVERGREGAVQHLYIRSHHLDVAGAHRRVFAARRPLPDVALDLNHPLLPQLFGGAG